MGIASYPQYLRPQAVTAYGFQGFMALMDLTNGFFVDYFSASWVLYVNGAVFVGIMLLSFLVATPRRVYISGIPAEAHALPREALHVVRTWL